MTAANIVMFLAAKGVFRLGRCYIFWQGVPDLWVSNREKHVTDG